MPTKVPIEVFFIQKSCADRDEMKRWLEFKGFQDYELPPEETVTDAALTIGVAAKRCYLSFDTSQNKNLTKVRADWGEYLDNVLKVGHGSVLEHATYTFAIENVSRVFTGEMNRHRAGWAISEGSMRFIRFGEDIPYWEPTSIAGPNRLNSADSGLFDAILDGSARMLDRFDPEATLEEKKHATRLIFEKAFLGQQRAYRLMEVIWADELRPESTFKQKKELTSLFRRIVGMGCATGGVWTGNIRALRHVMTMRCDPAAEEEILHVFSRVAVEMKKREPMLLGDFEQDEAGYFRPRYKKV